MLFRSGAVNSAAGPDATSRVAWPGGLNVTRAELVVLSKSDATSCTIVVNGTSTGRSFTSIGRIAITDLAAAAAGTQQMTVTISGAGASTVTFALELLATTAGA